MRKIVLALSFCLLQMVASAVEPGVKVPRPAPELNVILPSGQPLALSSLKGKVVIVECLYTTCPHCQHEAQLLSKLQAEYGPRGFQVVGVAYNPMSGMYVPEFIKQNNVTFPVGSSDRDTVLNFLFNDVNVQTYVPQVVVIDRSGVIRDQTPPQSDVRFQQEATLRPMIEKLLAEPAPRATTARPKK